MPNWRMFLSALVLTLLVSVGCQRSSSENATDIKTPTTPPTWLEQGLEVEGRSISLGYRGSPPRAGESLEPTVAITQDGKPVAEAMVFLRLVAADGQTFLGDEVATVFEPATAGNVACYAQGKLRMPEKGDAAAIRFRLILPGRDEDWTKDLVLPSK